MWKDCVFNACVSACANAYIIKTACVRSLIRLKTQLSVLLNGVSNTPAPTLLLITDSLRPSSRAVVYIHSNQKSIQISDSYVESLSKLWGTKYYKHLAVKHNTVQQHHKLWLQNFHKKVNLTPLHEGVEIIITDCLSQSSTKHQPTRKHICWFQPLKKENFWVCSLLLYITVNWMAFGCVKSCHLGHLEFFHNFLTL